MTELEQRLQKATAKLDQLKALQQQKLSVQRQREKVKARKERDHHIYKLGGLLEKMGLDALPDEVLLGAFAYIHSSLESLGWFETMANAGKEYLAVGKKLKRSTVPSN